MLMIGSNFFNLLEGIPNYTNQDYEFKLHLDTQTLTSANIHIIIYCSRIITIDSNGMISIKQ